MKVDLVLLTSEMPPTAYHKYGFESDVTAYLKYIDWGRSKIRHGGQKLVDLGKTHNFSSLTLIESVKRKYRRAKTARLPPL